MKVIVLSTYLMILPSDEVSSKLKFTTGQGVGLRPIARTRDHVPGKQTALFCARVVLDNMLVSYR